MLQMKKSLIREALREFRKSGYKAMCSKYSKEERMTWAKKGAEATRKRWKKISEESVK